MRNRNSKGVKSMPGGLAIVATIVGLSLGVPCALAQKDSSATTPNPYADTDMRGTLLPRDYDVKKVAQTKISINVQDATLSDIVQAISGATIESKAIEVRYPAFERISLKVKQVPLEDVLRGVASLNHLNLYVLPDRFVIGRYFMLSEAERKNAIEPDFESPNPPVISKEEAQRNLERSLDKRKDSQQ